MSQPLVSVCIPAYNAEKYIAAALDSVLNQSYPHLEVVVVNDGSKDSTGNILETYKEKGVKVLHQENRGQCAAANAAFQHCTGAYIKFFDADDLLSPHFIANQVERVNGREDAIASAAWGRFYQDDLNSFHLENEPVYKDMLPMEWLIASFTEGHVMMQCALWLIPRKVLCVSGLWDERLSLINDFDFFIRVILASKEVLYTKDATLFYRSGIESSLSGQKSKKAMLSAYHSVKRGTDTILYYENSPRTRQICADAFQLWAYQFYPDHMDLFHAAQCEVTKLGGSRLLFPSGGKTKAIAYLLGWKKTKQLKSLLRKIVRGQKSITMH